MLRLFRLFSFCLIGAGCSLAGAESAPKTSFAKDLVEARAAWEAEAAKTGALIEKLKGLARSLAGLEEQITKLRGEIRALERKRDNDLDELRRGQFCNGCGRTRSEILGKGERFPHDGQHERPATPEEIQRAEEKFASQLDPMRQRLRALEADQSRRQGEIDSAKFAFNTGLPVLHIAIGREQSLRITAWGFEQEQREGQLRDRQNAVTSAENAVQNATDTDEARARASALRAAQKQLAAAVRDAWAEHARAEREADAFVRSATQRLASLSSAASPLPQKFGLAGGWFMGKQITNVARPVAVFLSPVAGSDVQVAIDEAEPAESREPGESKPGAMPGGDTKQSMRDYLDGK